MRQFDDLSVNALFLSWGGVNPRDGMSPKLPLVSGFLLGEVERGSCVDERKEKREVSAKSFCFVLLWDGYPGRLTP